MEEDSTQASELKRDYYKIPFKGSGASVTILADDYLISYTDDILVNNSNNTMYVLPQTIEVLRSIKETEFKPIPNFFKIISAINDQNSNIRIFEKFTFYEKKKDSNINNIDHIIKVALFLKFNGFEVTVMTNDIFLIYYCLVNNIKIHHTIDTNFDTERIKSNGISDIAIYDTCYLISHLTEEELYDNFPKLIYSCVFEELIKNFKEIHSVDNLLYKLVDFIQDPASNVIFKNTISNYPSSNSIWNDSIILFNIMLEENYKETVYLKTADCQLESEALLFGIRLKIIYDCISNKDSNNIDIVSSKDATTEDNKETQQDSVVTYENTVDAAIDSTVLDHMTIILKKIDESWYVSETEKEKINFQIVSKKDLKSPIHNHRKFFNNEYFIKLNPNDYILIGENVYRLFKMKGKNNLLLINKKDKFVS